MIQVEPAVESGQVVRFRLAPADLWAGRPTTPPPTGSMACSSTPAAPTPPASCLCSQEAGPSAGRQHPQPRGPHRRQRQRAGTSTTAPSWPTPTPFLSWRIPASNPCSPIAASFGAGPGPSRGQPIGEWVETDRYRFQVIHTPGHSPDHICLFEPEQGGCLPATPISAARIAPCAKAMTSTASSLR